MAMVATMMNRDKNTRGKDRINSQDQQGYYVIQSLFHRFAFIARKDKEKLEMRRSKFRANALKFPISLS
jgi:hypothetical protein